jgi:choline dehydrogenase-like flavoprotein
VIDPTSEPGSFEFGVLLLKPRSRGSVRLRSNNPADPPSITLPSLDDPSDVERLGECYRRAIDVANRPELRSLCAELATADPGDDAALRARVRMDAYSVPHVVGTCALGSAVDVFGRVLGTERLSVADASVMPDVPSGFTHIPTIMIAERLSEQLASLL